MTQLDLDTTALATAAVDLRSAASSLGDLSGGVLAAAATPDASGDTRLSAALQDVAAAWRTAHEALESELGSLGAGLAHAAEVFEGAERSTAQELAALLGGPRPEGVA
ncbi:hypothetical protein ACH436_18575 [Isoptericola sp. NPDC019693]|uniref:hypothetical protein n=1 Tax=Isoptericola sp. NPDC019693 TaxID=3364009 RepID=UPI0037A09AE1